MEPLLMSVTYRAVIRETNWSDKQTVLRVQLNRHLRKGDDHSMDTSRHVNEIFLCVNLKIKGYTELCKNIYIYLVKIVQKNKQNTAIIFVKILNQNAVSTRQQITTQPWKPIGNQYNRIHTSNSLKTTYRSKDHQGYTWIIFSQQTKW